MINRDFLLGQIMKLKIIKIKYIQEANNKKELYRNLKQCDRIDILLFPLYYAMEKIMYYPIQSLLIEESIVRSYRLFCTRAKSLTQELYNWLSKKSMKCLDKQTTYSLLYTYKQILS